MSQAPALNRQALDMAVAQNIRSGPEVLDPDQNAGDPDRSRRADQLGITFCKCAKALVLTVKCVLAYYGRSLRTVSHVWVGPKEFSFNMPRFHFVGVTVWRGGLPMTHTHARVAVFWRAMATCIQIPSAQGFCNRVELFWLLSPASKAVFGHVRCNDSGQFKAKPRGGRYANRCAAEQLEGHA